MDLICDICETNISLDELYKNKSNIRGHKKCLENVLNNVNESEKEHFSDIKKIKLLID